MGKHGGMHKGMMGHHGMGMMGHGPGMGMMGGMPWKGMRFGMLIAKILKHRADLKLSDDQAQKLKGIRADYIRTKLKLLSDIKIAKFDMMDMFDMKNPDYNGIRATLKKISDLKLQKKLSMIDAIEKGSQVLSKEQKDKLMQMLSSCMHYESGESEENPEEQEGAE